MSEPSISDLLQQAVASHKAGDIAVAVKGYRHVLDKAPSHPDALNLCGVALSQLGDYDSAIPLLVKALDGRPDFTEAAYNLGVAYQHTGAYAQSVRTLQKVLAAQPDHAKALLTYATVSHDLDDHDVAAEAFTRVLTLQPDAPPVRYQAGLFYLTRGDWSAGWRNYEARFQVIDAAKGARRASPPRYWSGEPLRGASILAWSEQGLGEELLATAALAHTMEDAAAVTFECSQRMVPLVQRSLPHVNVVPWDAHDEVVADAIQFDFQCPALELTTAWFEGLEKGADSRPFVTPDPQRLEALRQKYETLAQGRRIVGLSWFSKNEDFGARKSLPVADLASAVSGDDRFLVSLQYGDHAGEIRTLAAQTGIDIFVDPDVDAVADLEAAFAQCAAMDLVVTTSNSVAHMGGALGVETWVLLPTGFASPWFWLLDRSDSPWYPSVRLFRSDALRDSSERWWAGPCAGVRATLQQHRS